MSGSTIGGFVGAGIGFLVSGGNPAGARWGWMIGSAVGGYVDPAQIEGPRLQDVRAQTSRDGIPIPFGWGTFPVAGNIIAQGPVVERKKSERQGKGGPEVTNYTYTRTYAIGLCEGPITGVLQVKRNGKVVYDARTDKDLAADIARGLSGVELTGFIGSTFRRVAAAIRAANSRFDNKVTFYLGNEAQMPDPALEAIFGAGKVPAHRGLAYFVVEDDDVTDTAGAIPQFEVVVARSGTVGNVCYGHGAKYYFPLNDAGGVVAHETIQNKDGAYSGVTMGPPIRAGATGSAYFSSNSDYMLADYLDIFRIDGRNPEGWTIAVYARPTEGVAGSVLKNVATTWSDPLAGTRNWSLCFRGTDNMSPQAEFSADGTNSYFVGPANQISAGSTVYMMATYTPTVLNNTGVYRLYVNGILAFELKANQPDWSGKYLAMGGYAYPGSYGFIGYASDLAIYARAFSAQEAADAYLNSGALIPIPDAPGHYVTPLGTVVNSGCTDTIGTALVPLSTIVADVCERRGLPASEYDVSQLTDLVPGFVVGRETDAASIIQSLAPAYFFDPAEWDGKLRFVKRGGTAVASFNGDDLVERDGDAFERERVQEAELLRRVTVAYNDPMAGYAPTTQKWERRAGTVQALGEASVELPLTLAADGAATIAKRRGLTAWGEPEKQKFSLPYRLAKLTPTDVVNYTDDDGEVHTLRLMDLQDDSGVRYVESSSNRAEAYGATASGVIPVAPSLTDPALRGPTLLAVMDLPLWRGGDTDTLGLYVAARGLLSGWQGAVVAVSTDSGVSYSNVTQITQQAAIGATTTALVADVSSEYPSGQALTVTLPRAPESVSYESLLRYNNRAALKLDSGAWEILQYQNVVAVDATTFTLSGLVRGRYATTPGAAAAGATFVLLDAAVQFVPVERHLLGTTFKVRATTFGTSSDAAVPADFAFTAGASQAEWPVHSVTATRDVSGNVTVTWVGRARLGVETAPYHSTNFTGYRVTYSDGQTFDVGPSVASHTRSSAPASQTITVRPLNTITGAGPASAGITV